MIFNLIVYLYFQDVFRIQIRVNQKYEKDIQNPSSNNRCYILLKVRLKLSFFHQKWLRVLIEN